MTRDAGHERCRKWWDLDLSWEVRVREGGNVPTCVPKRSAELSCIRCRKLGGAAAKCDSSHSSKEGLRLKRSATHSGLYLRLVWAWLCVCVGTWGAGCACSYKVRFLR